MSDAKGKSVVDRANHLKGARGTWESHWEEVAERVWPAMAGSFQGFQFGGEKRTDKMLDATPALANQRFAAVVESMVTPRGAKWHRIRMQDRLLRDNPRVKLWCDEVRDGLFRYRYAAAANFAGNQTSKYMSLGSFGTGVTYIDRLPGKGGTRYRAVPLGECLLDDNHAGIIDTNYRRFRLSARDAERMLNEGEFEKLPERITKAAAGAGSKPDEMFWFIHAVKPNTEMDTGRADYRGMAFESCYVAADDMMTVRRGGYRSFPFAVSRYVQAPGEVYARSPAMLALPSIKVLNAQKETALKVGHRLADPTLLAHDDGVLDSFSIRPGAINYGGVDSQGRKLVTSLDMPNGQLPALDRLMEQERLIVNDIFLVTLFQILVETPQMTATEVLERVQEKGVLLAPTMGRVQSEDLGPMIEREIDILAEDGLLPPPPPEVVEAGAEYDIMYDSPLSRAMRAEEAAGFFRTVEQALTVASATGDPAPLDQFDFDAAIPDIAEINAVPASWMATAEKIAAARAGRQQAQAAETAIQAGPAAAAVIKATQ